MAIEYGQFGVRLDSYEILLDQDGMEICEDCIYDDGKGPESDEFQPIFLSNEMDRNPTCDNCGKYSFVFMPTDDCVKSWKEMVAGYTEGRGGNYMFLHEVATHLDLIDGVGSTAYRTALENYEVENA